MINWYRNKQLNTANAIKYPTGSCTAFIAIKQAPASGADLYIARFASSMSGMSEVLLSLKCKLIRTAKYKQSASINSDINEPKILSNIRNLQAEVIRASLIPSLRYWRL